ncbi:hypothetical protein BJX96DRAFT_182749 [Aspergillus floccosus]
MTISPQPPYHGEIYELERQIQLKSRGVVSDIEIDLDEEFETFARDPWIRSKVDSESSQARSTPQAAHHKVLIVGAGHGGLLFAVRLIQTGAFVANDLLLVDKAAGFGGTWYWNRYPGIMCDTESYIYMPLLEETGYMPSEKYATGAEIRAHTQRIAREWSLVERAMFRTEVRELHWDEAKNLWRVSALQAHGEAGEHKTAIQLTADFAIIAPGVFASPRIPAFPAAQKFNGRLFHTARWDYAFTGGTPDDPVLTGLREKKVAIIGTGASAVQIVPHLARYCKELVVFQRTPSSVAKRDNRPTDPEWWQSLIQGDTTKGWQRRRMENFNAFTSNQQPHPEINMVADGWTEIPSFSVLIGAEQGLDPKYLNQMQEVDRARQQRIRNRVHDIVRAPETASLLAPWYPGWCKRPCFHDEYLPAFNRSNVRLVDIRDQGISHFTAKGVVAGNVEYELDAVIFSTGFTVPATRSSPGSRANIAVTGRHGLTMENKWNNGLATLHGVMTRGLPNLFFPGMAQAGACANMTYSLDQSAAHVAYILSKAQEIAREKHPERLRVVIEPTAEAEEDWAMQVVSRAAALRGIAGCTPGYLNGYGMIAQPTNLEEQKKLARLAAWGEGIVSYVNRLEAWREEGNLRGLNLTYLN